MDHSVTIKSINIAPLKLNLLLTRQLKNQNWCNTYLNFFFNANVIMNTYCHFNFHTVQKLAKRPWTNRSTLEGLIFLTDTMFKVLFQWSKIPCDSCVTSYTPLCDPSFDKKQLIVKYGSWYMVFWWFYNTFLGIQKYL